MPGSAASLASPTPAPPFSMALISAPTARMSDSTRSGLRIFAVHVDAATRGQRRWLPRILPSVMVVWSQPATQSLQKRCPQPSSTMPSLPGPPSTSQQIPQFSSPPRRMGESGEESGAAASWSSSRVGASSGSGADTGADDTGADDARWSSGTAGDSDRASPVATKGAKGGGASVTTSAAASGSARSEAPSDKSSSNACSTPRLPEWINAASALCI
mmetsp:Transcript_8399/g.23865  ORF Transcript_8399/g.23865 Transcript_8399/m.23865 type:complete len:216 (-) Transcript_8399:201-848(-)